jgi:hypothetical protein
LITREKAIRILGWNFDRRFWLSGLLLFIEPLLNLINFDIFVLFNVYPNSFLAFVTRFKLSQAVVNNLLGGFLTFKTIVVYDESLPLKGF